MARFARALTRILPALFLVLEATPSFAATEMRSPARRATIAAVVAADHVAAPLRGAVPDEPRGLDAGELAVEPTPLRSAKVLRVTDGARVFLTSPERTWLQVHRRRAPSPDDPDPY